MEDCIQYNKYRISLFVLPDFLLIGIGLGYTIDEKQNINKSLNIGAAFLCLAFTIIDEEPYKNLY